MRDRGSGLGWQRSQQLLNQGTPGDFDVIDLELELQGLLLRITDGLDQASVESDLFDHHFRIGLDVGG